MSSGTQDHFSTLRNSSFHRYTAGGAGGAVFIAGGFLNIGMSDFIDNVVGEPFNFVTRPEHG